MDKRDEIWSEFSKSMTDIDKIMVTINHFVYLKDDELINEYSEESYNLLKQAVAKAEVLLATNEYTDKEIFRYRNCIDEGHRVLRTSSILKPLTSHESQ